MTTTTTTTTTTTVILGGGCYWGMEDLFRKLPGVVDTEVGYAGGTLENPTYNDVKTGRTGHAEAIRVRYDPNTLSYRQVLEFFFQIHDPTTVDRQGNDLGTQYRSAIFYGSAAEREEALQIIGEIDASKRWPGKVATRLEPAGPFTPAEDYHQDYLEKFPQGYTCHFVRPDWTLKDSA